MALSDYLTGDEWDACFYRNLLSEDISPSFGHSMKETIQELLKRGHKFPGLNNDGSKKQQVEDGVNAPKIGIFFGNSEGLNVRAILRNGRNFLKENYTDMVLETDEEFEDLLKKE